MSSVTEEIQHLHLRMLELEKQKKGKDENDKKTSIDYNFKVINDVLDVKKKSIVKLPNSKSEFIALYKNQEIVTHLEAIYNILRIIDERLTKLEEK